MSEAQPETDTKGKDLLFAQNRHGKTANTDDDREANAAGEPWKVMVIDDDDAVHQVTVMVLADYTFENRPVEIIQGYSGGAGRNLMKKHPDTAVLLLDVVMETDTAGLDAAKYIRDELHNHAVRIIIRTGQPGQLPEESIISDYEINGYVSKTELTAQKLFSCLSKSLSDYNEMKKVSQQAEDH